MAAYQLLADGGVLRAADGVRVPPDAKNKDWRRYQTWLAVPNTPDEVPEEAAPTRISCADFFYRFTDEEKLLVQAACNAIAALGVGMVHGLALGYVDLDGAAVDVWLDGLVSEEAITTERKAILLTP